MAKFKVTADVITLVSSLKTEDFRKVLKYFPNAAVAVDDKGNQVFRVSFDPLANNTPMNFGVAYGATDFSGRMIAQFGNPVQGCHTDIEAEKKLIAEKYASVINMINEIEANIAGLLPQVEEMEAKVMESVVIEGGE